MKRLLKQFAWSTAIMLILTPLIDISLPERMQSQWVREANFVCNQLFNEFVEWGGQ